MSLDFGVRGRAKRDTALDKLIRGKQSRMQNQNAVDASLCRLTPNRRKMILNRVAQLAVVLLTGALVKLYYSTASVNELRWILAPTASLVEFFSGTKFTFESYAGYMSSDHTYLIAASCAGVNFLITSFLMLSLTKLWRDRGKQIPWRFFAAMAVAAYLTTIVANTVRISSSLLLRGIPLEFGLTANQLHRLEGIIIYFGFLLLLFVISEKFGSDRAQANSVGSSVGLFRRSIFPLMLYYAITLGIPFANGAYRQGNAFLEHSLFVVLTSLPMILPIVMLQFYRQGAASAIDHNRRSNLLGKGDQLKLREL